MQEHNSADGTTLRVYVRVIDENGDHIDPDGWSANPNSANVVITEQPSAVHAGTKIGTGEYRFDWTGLTAIAENTVVHCEINGAIGGTAWTEWIEPVRVLRNPLTTLGTNAPSNWINSGAIAASAMNGKGDWLTTLGANAPAGWINAAAIVAAALNDKGNWSKAGDAMALTSGERSTLATAVEAALLNEGDGQQLLAAISAQVQALFDSGADIPVSTLVTLIRDGILNRVLSGNHDTAGTVGKLIQNADVATSTRLATAGYTAPDNAGITTLLARVPSSAPGVFTDLVQMIVNDGTINAQWTAKALELGPSGGGGGGGSSTTSEFDGDALAQIQQLITQTSQISGARITYAGPVKSGGRIILHAGDDYRVRATSNILLPISDAGEALFDKLTSVALGNLKFAASFDDASADLIVGTIAGVTHASGVTAISIEIPAAGIASSAKFRDGYEYQIQRTTADGDKVTEVTGSLELRRDRCT